MVDDDEVAQPRQADVSTSDFARTFERPPIHYHTHNPTMLLKYSTLEKSGLWKELDEIMTGTIDSSNSFKKDRFFHFIITHISPWSS